MGVRNHLKLCRLGWAIDLIARPLGRAGGSLGAEERRQWPISEHRLASGAHAHSLCIADHGGGAEEGGMDGVDPREAPGDGGSRTEARQIGTRRRGAGEGCPRDATRSTAAKAGSGEGVTV